MSGRAGRLHLLCLCMGAALLSGCQAPSVRSGGNSSQSMTVGGFQRSWIVHLPKGYDTSRRWPLVLAYHGLFGTSKEMESLTGLDAVADRDGFIVVYPQGIKRSWAGGVNSPADRLAVNDVAFTAALLDKLQLQYRIDPQRVVATGFSDGAHLVQLLGCRMAHRLSAIVPVGGEMPPGEPQHCQPSRPISVVEFHGAADPVDPYWGGKVSLLGGSPMLSAPATSAGWARRNGCAATPRLTAVVQLAGGFTVRRLQYPSCRDGVVVLYRIDGAGHVWPGGAQYLPETTVGRTAYPISASAVVGALATAQ